MCRREQCGNGTLDPGEQCDDGNLAAGDGCSATCAREVCGNGTLDPGESCDDGNTVGGDGCAATCQPETCGNGVLDPGEQCDDGPGHNVDTLACTHLCRHNVCGDGDLLVGVEACDDGNTVAGDGCSPTCALEACGNSVLDPGEQCDDGPGHNADDQRCTAACRRNVCGDGHVLAGGEACDDGNTLGGDGCSPTCAVEACGNGVVDVGEVCDAHGTACGACTATCDRVTSDRALGVLIVPAGDALASHETFAIDDGFGHAVTFELLAAGDPLVDPAAVAVAIAAPVADMTAAIVDAIHGSALLVEASAPAPGLIQLVHRMRSSAGNRAIADTIASPAFLAIGLAGGAGGACAPGAACGVDADCASGLCVAGACVACTTDADCGGAACLDQVCVR